MVHLHHYAGFHAHPYIHSRGTSSINITETNNIFIGGSYGSTYGGSVFSGGGFWNGFMNGIGLGLGNMLMGGLNMLGAGLFGGLFGGGMGMGLPFAGSMMPYQAFGNTSAGNCNCKCHGNTDGAKGSKGAKGNKNTEAIAKVDKDQAKLAELIKEVDAIRAKENPTMEEAKALYDKIKPLTTTPLDEENADVNKNHYAHLLDDLTEWAKKPSRNWDLSKPATKETNPKGANPTETGTDVNPTATATNTENKNPVKNSSGTNPAATTAPKTVEDYAQELEKVSTALASPDVTEEDIKKAEELYAKLPEGEDKDALGKNIKIAKAKLALKGISDNPEVVANLASISQTPAEKRAKEYGSNVNYNGTDEVTNVLRSHDNSGRTKDTVNKTGKTATITSDNGNHPETITMHDRKDITYTFLLKIDGEYLYESDQDHQIYALQKNSNGEFELVQYSYMKGFGEKDWS